MGPEKTVLGFSFLVFGLEPGGMEGQNEKRKKKNEKRDKRIRRTDPTWSL
jgi:hypothetical protein